MNGIKQRIWDSPTRLFHWLWVLAFVMAWLSAGDSRLLYWHSFAGSLFSLLLLFRVYWGFKGSRYARFKSLLLSPSRLREHLKLLLKARGYLSVGHNPLGSLMVVLLMLVAVGVVISGWLVFAGEEQLGPLAGALSIASGKAVHDWHEAFAWFMLLLAFLHITGVVLESLLLRENLIAAMIAGKKRLPRVEKISNHRSVARVMLLALLLLAGWYGAPWLVLPDKSRFRPYPEYPLAQNSQWRELCGECHVPFHPSLAPARIWRTLLQQQSDHFGEDLFLSLDELAGLERYALANAAEQAATETAWHVAHSTPMDFSSLRISELPYWRQRHRKIDAQNFEKEPVSGKADCAACHLDASQGSFRDGAMRLPRSNSTKLRLVMIRDGKAGVR